jgi:hypothetical protein
MSCLRTIAATEAGHPEWAELPSTRKEARAVVALKYFTGKACGRDHVALRWTSGGLCLDCHRICAREKQRCYSRTQAYRERDHAYEKTPARRASKRDWEKTPARRDYQRAYTAYRNALKLKATPRWLTAEHHAAIRAIYEEAARLTIETGIPHHVDHDVPLKATCPVTKQRNACGLHVPWNLKPMPASDNCSKGANFNGGWS